MSSGALNQLTLATFRTLRRFPLVLVAAFVAAGAAIAAVDDSPVSDPLMRVALVAALGLPLLFALTIFAERRGQPPLLWQSIGAMFLGLFYLVWPGWVGPGPAMRYIQFSLGFHLLAAALPFLGVTERTGFWQYNRVLLSRFLTAGVFSAVLFLGLVIALLATDNLLGINVADRTYIRLWLVMAFVFNTWFFLGGIPEDLSALDAYTEYPLVLKVFAQYILTPIVALYLLILTIYLGRILVTTTWPSGWIGYLVSSVAVLGILAFLLVHPIRERAENRWIGTFSRGFFIALFPSIVMLLMAIWQRINQYGITEKRYFVVVLALWLAGISAYYTIRPKAHLKLIPVSLALVAFLSAAGPWSAYAISLRSQTSRLEALFEANDMLTEGTARPPASDVSFADRREMSAILRYLLQHHDTASVTPWLGRLPAPDTAMVRTWSRRYYAEQRAGLIMASLDLEYVDRWETGTTESFSYRAEGEREVTRITGYDYVLRGGWTGQRRFSIGGTTYAAAYDGDVNTLRILGDGRELVAFSLDEFLVPIRQFALRNPAGRQSIPMELMEARAEGNGVRVLLIVRHMSGTVERTGTRLNRLNGELYLGVP